MATVVKRNNRSQDEIRKSLGMIADGSGSSSGYTVYSGSQTPLRATSGTGAAPAGWYGDYNTTQKPGDVIGFSAPNASSMGGAAVGVLPTAEEYKGISTPGASSAAGFTTSRNSSAPQRTGFVRQTFTPSADTDEYYDLMKETEEDRPDAFQSKYEGAIQNILDGILNRKSFDLDNDSNYQQLYNLYSQQYQTQADRAMRDTMGAMQAATGGYGSTAATAAAGQAYDRTMEGLNDRNMQLMQMAYGMYQDENADRYNQLNAVNGLDQSDYARYRDTVSDWMNDRAYYANQFQNMYGNDWNQYQFDTSMDWNEYQDALNRAWQEKTYGEEQEYRKERDAISDYNDNFNLAYKMAASGQQVPAHYAALLDEADVAQLNALAQQIQAEALMGGSGGGGGRGGRGGRSRSGLSKSQLKEAQTYQKNLSKNDDEAYKRALFYSGKGWNDEQVQDMLIDYGYTDKAIAAAMNRLRPYS